MVDAIVAGSSLVSGGGVTVTATSTRTLFSEGASVSVNVQIQISNPPISIALTAVVVSVENVVKGHTNAGINPSSRDRRRATCSSRRKTLRRSTPGSAGARSRIGLIAVGATVVIATNTIENTVDAYVTDSTVTSTAGNVSVKADSRSDVKRTLSGAIAMIDRHRRGRHLPEDHRDDLGRDQGPHRRDFRCHRQPRSRARRRAWQQHGFRQVLRWFRWAHRGLGDRGNRRDHRRARSVATVGTGATVTADAITVSAAQTLPAGSTNSITAELVAGSVGIGAGAGGSITARDASTITAQVLTGASLNAAGGSVSVLARRTAGTDANAEGGAGGLLAAAGFTVSSRIEGSTSAIVNAGVTVTANSLTVDANATVNALAKQFVLCIGGVCASVAAPNGAASAAADDTVEARLGGVANAAVGPTSPLVSVTGLVQVRAGGTRTVHAPSRGGAGGALAAAGVVTKAQLRRRHHRDPLGGGLRLEAGSLTVETYGPTAAGTTRTVTAEGIVGSAGALSGAGGSATATITGSTDAFDPAEHRTGRLRTDRGDRRDEGRGDVEEHRDREARRRQRQRDRRQRLLRRRGGGLHRRRHRHARLSRHRREAHDGHARRCRDERRTLPSPTSRSSCW